MVLLTSENPVRVAKMYRRYPDLEKVIYVFV